MELYERLESDAREALRSQDREKLSVLRLVIASVRTLALEKTGAVTEQETLQVIQRHIKQRKESIEQFTRGNRPDLVAKETAELRILEAYLPAQLSDAEVRSAVAAAIAETGAASKADIGKVMKLVMERVRGKADGKAVNRIVAELLP